MGTLVRFGVGFVGLAMSLQAVAAPATETVGPADLVPPEVWARTTIREGGFVDAVCFSPDGKSVATGWSAGPVSFWDAATGNQISPYPPLGYDEKSFRSNRQLAWSPDGATIAVLGNEGLFGPPGLRLKDIKAGTLTATDIADVETIAFAGTGKSLYAAGTDGTITQWDVKAAKISKKFKGPETPKCLDVSPDDSLLLVASGPGFAEFSKTSEFAILDTTSGATVASLKGPKRLPIGQSACFVDGGKAILYLREKNLLVAANATTQSEIRTIAVPEPRVMAFSPDHKRLAVVEKGDGYSTTIRVIDTQTGGIFCTLAGLSSDSQSIAFASDKKTIVAAHSHGALVWTIAKPGDGAPIAAATRLAGIWEGHLECDRSKARSHLKEIGIPDDQLNDVIERRDRMLADEHYVFNFNPNGTGTVSRGDSSEKPDDVFNLTWSVASEKGRTVTLRLTVEGQPEIDNVVIDASNSFRMNLRQLKDSPAKEVVIFTRVDSDLPDRYETDMEKLISGMRDVTAIVQGIRDESSAKAVNDKLKPLRRMLAAVHWKTLNAGQLAAVKSIRQKYEAEQINATAQLEMAIMALRTHPDLDVATQYEISDLPVNDVVFREIVRESAGELIGNFQKDPRAARDKYDFKTVFVVGKVRAIVPPQEYSNFTTVQVVGSDQPDEPSMHLAFQIDRGTPLDETLKGLKPGMVVAVTGGINAPSDRVPDEIVCEHCVYLQVKN